MATSDVIVIEVGGDPGDGIVVVGVAGADAESFLVADGVSVVQSDALGPVQAEAAAAAVDVGGRPVALSDGAVYGVL